MKNIEIKKLNKKYGDIFALSDFSYEFNSGGKYAVIGPCGSGKTTLLSIIAGIEDFDGDVKIGDKNRKELALEKANISYILSDPVFFEGKSVLKNLEYQYKVCGKEYTVSEVVSLIEEHNLDPYEKVKKLSYIEKLILSIVRAKVKSADILLIDLNDFVELLENKSDALTELVLLVENYPWTVIVAENGVNFASKLNCKKLFLNFGVNKGEIDFKNEIENPTNFYLYKCALQSVGAQDKPILIEVEKLMCGLSISSSGLSTLESDKLKKLINHRMDFKIGDRIEIYKLGEYFFEAIGGNILK